MTENKDFVDVPRALALFRHGKYQSIAGAGHLIPMQKPQEIAAIIREFNRQIA